MRISLSFRVLKARYFPSSDPSEVETTQRASFIWRRLLKRKKIVSSGATWRVGNGQKIRVWRDKWITQLPTGGPSQPDAQIPTLMKVSRLIIDEERRWNE